MIENPKMQTYQIKSKPILGSVCLVWSPRSCRSSPVQRSGFQSCCFLSPAWSGPVGVRCGWAGARGWTAGCSPPSPWWSSEERTVCWGTEGDRGTQTQEEEEVPGVVSMTTRTSFYSDCYTHSFGEHAHELGELVCEQSQHGGEGAEAGREQDEEGQLLLRVDRHFVEHCFQVGHKVKVSSQKNSC